MRKLITAALLLAAALGTPSVASARDWNGGWYDGGRYEYRYDDRRYWDDRDWRDYRRDRRHWRRDRDRWERRHWRRHAWRGDIVCRTYWHWGRPERVCYRR